MIYHSVYGIPFGMCFSEYFVNQVIIFSNDKFVVLFLAFCLAWMYIGMIGGYLFILLQLILLIDFAYNWSESW